MMGDNPLENKSRSNTSNFSYYSYVQEMESFRTLQLRSHGLVPAIQTFPECSHKTGSIHSQLLFFLKQQEVSRLLYNQYNTCLEYLLIYLSFGLVGYYLLNDDTVRLDLRPASLHVFLLLLPRQKGLHLLTLLICLQGTSS